MRLHQKRIEKRVVLFKTLHERRNAMYENYDSFNRFNFRIYNQNRFDNQIFLNNHNSAIKINDIVF